MLKRHLPHIALHVILGAALTVALLTAGGVSLVELSHQPKAPKVPVAVVSQHVCDHNDLVQGCVLPQATLGDIEFGLDPAPIQGVDFAWSCPVTQAKSFGASYVSYDTSKNWTRACVDLFHRDHKATVAVWEAGGSDATAGASLGAQETRDAIAQLTALGAGPHQPVILAIDCDCSGTSILGYFQGANTVNGQHPIEAYGGYYQLQFLYSRHLIGHANWQTYAWSGGHWLPASVAPLEQYLNSSAVDYDRSLAPYYGQWPNNTKPKPKPRPRNVCFGKGWQHTAHCNQVRAQALHLGARIKQEKGYASVSAHNLTVIKARLGLEDRRAAAYQKQLCGLLAGSPVGCR